MTTMHFENVQNKYKKASSELHLSSSTKVLITVMAQDGDNIVTTFVQEEK